MSAISSTAVVLAEDPAEQAEAMAVGGFLAGYAGATRTSYATDLRIFAIWCRQADLRLLTVKRSHLELFGRWMEETGRMRSTVARRLSTSMAVRAHFELLTRAGFRALREGKQPL